jgi:hypothetical protein
VPISITIRDVKDAAGAGIDLAARSLGIRSREAFLRDFLDKHFGEQRVTQQISTRFRVAAEALFAAAGRYELPSDFCAAELARLLGHVDTAKLDGELQGDIPLPFDDGDKFCELVGLNRRWLINGTSTPYDSQAKYRTVTDMYRDIYQHGATYIAVYFILSKDERGTAAVYAQTSPYRYERLIDDVPIHDNLSSREAHELREFCFFSASISHTAYQEIPMKRAISGPGVSGGSISLFGRVMDEMDYRALLSGAVHPAIAVNGQTGSSPWHEDIYDLEFRGNTYSNNYVRARAAWRASIRDQGITTNEQLLAHIKERLVHWQPNDLEVAQMLQRADAEPKESLSSYFELVERARSGDGRDRMQLRELFWTTRAAQPDWIGFDAEVG